MTSSQTPRPMPKPKAPSREEVKVRVRAKVEAEKALPASERIANVLHATHTTGEALSLLDRFRAENLNEAIEAARSEYLTDATGDETDEAYNRGISDAIAAIGALLDGGAS